MTAIYERERQLANEEKEITGAKGVFKAKQRKELQEQAEQLKTQEGTHHEIDTQCYDRVELFVEQRKIGVGITEELKSTNQMKWVGLMNNVRNSAEKIVLKQRIYV